MIYLFCLLYTINYKYGLNKKITIFLKLFSLILHEFSFVCNATFMCIIKLLKYMYFFLNFGYVFNLHNMTDNMPVYEYSLLKKIQNTLLWYLSVSKLFLYFIYCVYF